MILLVIFFCSFCHLLQLSGFYLFGKLADVDFVDQNMARKANQLAIVAEKKREDAPEEPRGVSKQKWFEEKKRKVGKQLESNGLDMSKAYMLDTQEVAEDKYKKWEKKPAPFGWDGKFLAI